MFFGQDEEGEWVAQLECLPCQHIRHDPPFSHRPWMLTEEGRERFVGLELECKKCDEGAPLGLIICGRVAVCGGDKRQE
jgi:hypothetical protein